MKLQIVLCLATVAVMVSARPEEYTGQFDDVDLDEILNNRRLLLPYLKCVTDEGRCTPDGKELKLHIKEALQEDCAKCTEFQKNNSKRVLAKVINDEPAYWDKIKAKYDPQDAFSSAYEQELKTK